MISLIAPQSPSSVHGLPCRAQSTSQRLVFRGVIDLPVCDLVEVNTLLCSFLNSRLLSFTSLIASSPTLQPCSPVRSHSYVSVVLLLGVPMTFVGQSEVNLRCLWRSLSETNLICAPASAEIAGVHVDIRIYLLSTTHWIPCIPQECSSTPMPRQVCCRAGIRRDCGELLSARSSVYGHIPCAPQLLSVVATSVWVVLLTLL